MNAVYNEFDNRKNLKIKRKHTEGLEYYAYPLVIKT